MALLADNQSSNGDTSTYVVSASGIVALQVQVVVDALADQFCVAIEVSLDGGTTFEPSGTVINRARANQTHGLVLPANAVIKGVVSGLNGSELDIQIL